MPQVYGYPEVLRLGRTVWLPPMALGSEPPARQLPRRQLGGRDSCYVQGRWALQGWSQRLIPRLQPALAGDGTCAGLLSEAGASPELLMVAQALQGSSGWLATLSRCQDRPRLGYSFPPLTPSPCVASERLPRSPVSAPEGRGGKRTQALGADTPVPMLLPRPEPRARAVCTTSWVFSLAARVWSSGSGARGCHCPSEMLGEGGMVQLMVLVTRAAAPGLPPQQSGPLAPPTPAPGSVFLL